MRDLSREQLLAELRALKPEFERRGVTRMALFGSRARGDNRPDSDVDLIVDIPPAMSLVGLAGIWAIIEDRLGLESSIVPARRAERCST
ncbi:MAG: nucleotidyltransferase domain-containing protein, partial [Hyphomicrobiales bacterium]